MKGSIRVRLAVRLGATSLCIFAALVAVFIYLTASGNDIQRYGYWRETSILIPTYAVLGLLITTRHHSNAIGWIFTLTALAGAIQGTPAGLVIGSIGEWVWAAGPASLVAAASLALLRYRLFDIDIIIRRTLQYTLLTGLLSGIYFGGVAILQALLAYAGSQPTALVIVLTTLAIAALFNPLRHHIQDLIDRRFYRQRYNAEHALAKFAATARSETDLGQLSGELVGMVQETVQPEFATLWLARARSYWERNSYERHL